MSDDENKVSNDFLTQMKELNILEQWVEKSIKNIHLKGVILRVFPDKSKYFKYK